MKKLCVKLLAALLAAVLLTTLAPAALMEENIAPVEAIDEAVSEAEFAELDGDAELPVEDGFVSGESYQAEMPSFEETGGVPIDEAHFPDPVLRQTLVNGVFMGLSDLSDDGIHTYFNKNHDEYLDTGEIAACTRLNSFAALTISDLRGLEYLTALESIDLVIEYTGTTLDLSGCINLKSINIWKAYSLTTLICPASLEYIRSYSTPELGTVDISRCTGLNYFEIHDSKVTSLDFSNNPNLVEIRCTGKALKTVTLGNQPNLKALACGDNAVASLDISGCPKLVPIVKDKYKEDYKKGEAAAGFPFPHTRWAHGDAEARVGLNIKLVTDKKGKTADDSVKKSETVTPAEDNSITASAKTTKTTVSVGQSYTLSVSGEKASGFKSSNKKVATVTKAGKIVPKKAGKAKITYKVNGKTRTVTLTVKDPTMPTSIKLDQSGTVASKVGDKITLNATLNEGAVSAIKWTTSNKKIATVKNGVVTFKKAGKVTITATTKRGNKKAKVKFTVSK